MRQLQILAAALLVAASLSGCVDVDGPTFDNGWPFHGDTTGFGWVDTVGLVRTDFEWRGDVDRGDAITILGVSGGIRAHWTSGDEVVVTATKMGTANQVARVRIEVVTHAGGVTICALYRDHSGYASPGECGAGYQRPGWFDHGNTRAAEVEFTVLVPEAVVLVGQTVSGHIEVADLRSDAFLTTVAGDVQVSTTRMATAKTVTGNITASIGSPDWDRDLDFTTVNGDIRLAIPSDTNADVYASVATGSITSEFPLTQTSSGTMRGVIGAGGRRLTLTAVAGDVALKRRP